MMCPQSVKKWNTQYLNAISIPSPFKYSLSRGDFSYTLVPHGSFFSDKNNNIPKSDDIWEFG